MATSPNYNWPEPDNTDLVKNGALAIRTLGNAIDTTMATMVPKSIVDAKGDLIAGTAADTTARLAVGNNGETLVADSSTATGLKWAPFPASGMTNPMTTTGDTIYSSSGSTPARLGIGSTGQVLTVAGGVPTWATPSAGGATGCTVYSNGTSQSLNGYTTTMIAYGAEIWDSNSYHDNTTNNSRITIPSGKAGKYQINASLSTTGIVTDWILFLFKNGAAVANVGIFEGKLIRHTVNAEGSCAVLDLAVGDYIQIGFASDLASGNYNVHSQFSAIYLGA